MSNAAVVQVAAAGATAEAVEGAGSRNAGGPGATPAEAKRQHRLASGSDGPAVLIDLMAQAAARGNRWYRARCANDGIHLTGAQVVGGFSVDTALDLDVPRGLVTASASSGASTGQGVIATEPLIFLSDCGPEVGPKIAAAAAP